MNTVLCMASEIVEKTRLIIQITNKNKKSSEFKFISKEDEEFISQANDRIEKLKETILNSYYPLIFNEIKVSLQREWNKQKYEASDMWKN